MAQKVLNWVKCDTNGVPVDETFTPWYVYKLLSNDEIVYVGYTRNIQTRMSGHKSGVQKKTFDGVERIECDSKREAKGLEKALIHRYHPPLNKVCTVCHVALPAAAPREKRVLRVVRTDAVPTNTMPEQMPLRELAASMSRPDPGIAA